MDWSILLGIAVIAYAAIVLVRHLRRMKRGQCAACPFHSGCDGHCSGTNK